MCLQNTLPVLQPNTFVKKSGCGKIMENINCVCLHTLQMALQMPGTVGSCYEQAERAGFFWFFFFALLTEAVPLTSYQRFPVRVLLMKKQRLRKFEKSVNGHMV
jgi:hypothetical protein